jgi:hypothetical protein
MYNSESANFFELVGQTITNISVGSETVTITTNTTVYTLSHCQSCCEHVRVYETFGEPQQIVGSPIVFAEEDAGAADPEWYDGNGYHDSHTWTHYTISTKDGKTLDIWWLGESNGYYGEDVSVYKSPLPANNG